LMARERRGSDSGGEIMEKPPQWGNDGKKVSTHCPARKEKGGRGGLLLPQSRWRSSWRTVGLRVWMAVM